MKLRTKITLLAIVSAVGVAFLTLLSIRGIIINAFRAELENRAISIAGNLSDRISNHILLNDYFQTTKDLNEVLNKENDLEYIFVTDEKGSIAAHTFNDGIPSDILTWNPLNDKSTGLQLLDTEKGYVRDVGIKIFHGTKAELHVGIREDNLKKTIMQLRKVTVPIIMFVTLLGVIAAFIVSRYITRPLNKFIEFTEALGKGEFDRKLEISSRDEIGYLAHRFNRLSMELRAAREKMEEAYTYTHLLQAEKLSSIGQISAGLAHELKNPVAALKMLFQAFSERPDMTKEDAEIIYNEIKKIDNILTQFLGFVKQKEVYTSAIDINALIARVLSLATFDIKRSGIVVHKDMAEDLPPVKGDGALLEQVFLNLVLNSIQAMPQGGEIRISGKPDAGYVEVTVQDEGIGIPSNMRFKVFEPFFTTKEGGTGLGLSIAYNIVKTHGGEIYFNSVEKGGTVFTVRLPKNTS